MKKWIIVLIVLAVAGAGVKFFFFKDKKQRGAGQITRVTVAEGLIEEAVEATGEVSPQNRVEIKPPVSGRIEKLLVDEGASVRAGQILAQMSSSDRAAILDAALSQGRQEYKKWEDTYKPTPIIAPLSGIIILRNVVVGQTVDASTILFAMSDKLIVVAQVDEADIARVRNKMPAKITLDAYPDTSIDGTVFQILSEGKNVSNVITYGVKIEPKNAPSYFRSQMTANVKMIVQQKENAVLIPAAAVKDGKNGKQVMIPGEDGKAVPRDVELGIQSGENVEVVSGLNVGDTILLTRTRYVPQKGQQTSPLTPSGPRRDTGRQTGGQRSGAGPGSGRN